MRPRKPYDAMPGNTISSQGTSATESAARVSGDKTRRGDRQLELWVCAALLAGALPGLKSNLVSFSIVVFVFLLPVTAHIAWKSTQIRRTLGLLGLWAAGQLLTDGYRFGFHLGTLASTWQPMLIAVSVVALYASFDSPRAAVRVAGTGLVSLIAFHVLNPGPGSSTDPWKFAFAIPVVLTASLVVGWKYRERSLLIPFSFMTWSIVNLTLGFRSFGAVCFVAAFVSMFGRRGARNRRTRVRWRIALALPVAAFLVFNAYAIGASNGFFGQDQEDTYRIQSASPAGLLLTGRPEVFVSYSLISAHPIIGSGSHRELSAGDMSSIIANARSMRLGMSESQQQRIFSDGGNSHSLLLGSWVAAGIAAVPFWIYALWTVVSALGFGVGFWRRLLPLATVWALLLCWDAIFSPWGPRYEFLLAGILALAIRLRESGRLGR